MLKETKMKRKKVSFLGLFGQGNLGNESTLQAILYHLHQHWPDAEVNCICTDPESTATTHNIVAVPMRDTFIKLELLNRNPLLRFLRKIFIGIPNELYRWLKALKTLKGTDMLIVPGTQFLSDNLSSPFGWPYMIFQWSIASKLRGCKLLFVSVGVGPLRHPLSRFFVKSALSLADYRSYRDELSRQYMRRIGFDSTNDPVYPDLAFSLPISTIPRDSHSNKGKSVIAVGVKDYYGQYDQLPPQYPAEDIYDRYLDEIIAFVAWLLEHMYTVRLVIGDVSCDTQVLVDLRNLLNERKVKCENLQIIDEPIESVEQLVLQLATSDIVVSPRFHNVVFALLLNKPVIAISYHKKFSALMEGSTLVKYNLPIDHLDANFLIKNFIELERNIDEIKLHVSTNVKKYQTDLYKQYNLIFNDLLHG